MTLACRAGDPGSTPGWGVPVASEESNFKMKTGRTIVHYLFNVFSAYDISFSYVNTSRIVGESTPLWKGAKISIIKGLNKTIMEEVVSLSEKVKISDMYFNQSIVSFVTALEVYLKDVLVSSIESNKSLLDNIKDKERKVQIKINDLVIKDHLGEAIASCFNFQNLNSTREAYQLIFKKDLFKVISFSLNFRGKELNSIALLKNLMNKRHQIVHNGVRYKLDFEEVQLYNDLLIMVGFRLYEEMVLPALIDKIKKRVTS